MLLTALVLCFAASGCRHSESHQREAQKESPGAPSSSASLPPGMDMFDLRAHPNATILHPLDLNTLTESERKFGIAPKRGPKVEYQPDIILMEQGDKLHSREPSGARFGETSSAGRQQRFWTSRRGSTCPASTSRRNMRSPLHA
jgi:hypothetical protein